MYDRRVVRGNTHGQHIIPTVSINIRFTIEWQENLRRTLFLTIRMPLLSQQGPVRP